MLPGFSKWVYDVTGYYEKNGFQARAAYRHRSEFKGEVVSLFSNLGFPLIQPDNQLDAQIGYTFQPGSRLNGLGILLQVSNVLNSPYRTYYDVNGIADAGDVSRNTDDRGCSAPVITSRGGFEMTGFGRSCSAESDRCALRLRSSRPGRPQLQPGRRAAMPPAPPNAALEARVRSIVAGMTLEQKIGQMTQPDIRSVTPDDVRHYYIGSVLNGGGAWPGMNMHASVGDWLKLSDAFYRASMSTDMKVKVPVIWGTDAVHGHNNVYGATLFPHNIGLGAAHDPALMTRIGRATAEQVRATGITWAFAPTLAVVQNPRWGRTYESYSSDPALKSALMPKRWSRGLQGQLGTLDVGARDGQALARRRRHVPRRRPGRNPHQRSQPLPHPCRRLLRRAQRQRADGDGQLFELHRHRDRQALGQDARQRPSRRRRAQEAARLRRPGRQRLERHRAGPGLHQLALPAGDQRRHRPGRWCRTTGRSSSPRRSRMCAPAASR